MNRNWLWWFIPVMMLFILSCDKSSSPIKTSTQPAKGLTEIISNPPGAKIEINDEYVGDTPIFVKLPRISRRSGNIYEKISVKAYPSQPGQYTQKKLIDTRRRVPARLLFDMNLEPVQPTQRIKIDDGRQ